EITPVAGLTHDDIVKQLTDFKHPFFFQAEDGIRGRTVTGVQTCALPILALPGFSESRYRLPQHEGQRLLVGLLRVTDDVGRAYGSQTREQIQRLETTLCGQVRTRRSN